MREDKWDANNLTSKVVTKFPGPTSDQVTYERVGVNDFINDLARKVGVGSVYTEGARWGVEISL